MIKISNTTTTIGSQMLMLLLAELLSDAPVSSWSVGETVGDATTTIGVVCWVVGLVVGEVVGEVVGLRVGETVGAVVGFCVGLVVGPSGPGFRRLLEWPLRSLLPLRWPTRCSWGGPPTAWSGPCV